MRKGESKDKITHETKENNMKLLKNKKGFTLVETMTAAFIISTISFVVLPSFMESKDKTVTNTCLANISNIQKSLEITAVIEGSSVVSLSGDEISNLVVPDYLQKMPACSLGEYSTNAGGEVQCSNHSGDEANTANDNSNGGSENTGAEENDNDNNNSSNDQDNSGNGNPGGRVNNRLGGWQRLGFLQWLLNMLRLLLGF